jgi:hypothetical protein
VATHDLDLAEGLLDRLVVLRDGRLLPVVPSAASLRDRYRDAIQSATANRSAGGPAAGQGGAA